MEGRWIFGECLKFQVPNIYKVKLSGVLRLTFIFPEFNSHGFDKGKVMKLYRGPIQISTQEIEESLPIGSRGDCVQSPKFRVIFGSVLESKCVV